ncbi:MAG: cell division protein ZapA [Nitrospiraceae bacterium]|nr:cell division protein ZapA [Nitrospiraceae bacterium]
MGSVDVYILGQKYTIKGEEAEEHIKKIASYVDTKIKNIHSNSPNITPLKASILASLEIADELYKIKASQDIISERIEINAELIANLFEK